MRSIKFEIEDVIGALGMTHKITSAADLEFLCALKK
jgi:hypothetical protein